MSFTLQYAPQAKEGVDKLAKLGLKHIAEKSLLKISGNPHLGKKLRGKLQGLYSTRITRKFRVIYQILSDRHIVFILDISHRKESYRCSS